LAFKNKCFPSGILTGIFRYRLRNDAIPNQFEYIRFGDFHYFHTLSHRHDAIMFSLLSPTFGALLGSIWRAGIYSTFRAIKVVLDSRWWSV
jgi:hypothetical protein